MQFNEAQIQAIQHNTGPCMVIAGPGSGKTTVLTHRVRYLIERYGVNPSDILVITFTKAAAEQMKLKFKGLSEGRNSAVTFSNICVVFFKQYLRQHIIILHTVLLSRRYSMNS